VTDRLRVIWPDPAPFVSRNRRPIRILAVSDEVDPTLDSESSRRALGPIDIVIGAGDLDPAYLSFVADAFGAPLHYVRGNHDDGPAWADTRRATLPDPLRDGVPVTEAGLRIIGFSGSPDYNNGEMQRSAAGMWLRVIASAGRARRQRPTIVVTHTPPRGVNDDTDLAHRGFTAFRWLADRLAPPLWLHGHTSLVRRGIDDRTARRNGTIFYNCTGATLIEVVPPGDAAGG
jgi:uncharacterized protein